PDAATERAIGEFGAAELLGRQLTETFHSRLWASTIGVLLPSEKPVDVAPGIVGMVQPFLLVMAFLTGALGVWTATHQPPLSSVLLLVAAAGSTCAGFLMVAGLDRARGWAILVSTLYLIAVAIDGAATFITSNGHTISITGLIGALLLVGVLDSWREIREWTDITLDQPLPVLAVTVLALGSWLLVPAIKEIPDPTQAAPSDLHIAASMECPRSGDGSLTATFRWDRVAVMPGGIANLDNYGDMLVLALAPSLAGTADYPLVRDASSGEVVGEPALLPPYGTAVESFHRDLNGPAMLGIEAGRLQAGHTYSVTWPVTFLDRSADVQADIEYWHLDRFRTELVVDCQRTVAPPFVTRVPSLASLGL
ncbi:MAG TPA: hypothetical protein VFK93_03445, partial [Candidatus Limnocylindria bacterium]|nr:hypothetical protein [Candidatus Limnocylindria bacterium]